MRFFSNTRSFWGRNYNLFVTPIADSIPFILKSRWSETGQHPMLQNARRIISEIRSNNEKYY